MKGQIFSKETRQEALRRIDAGDDPLIVAAAIGCNPQTLKIWKDLGPDYTPKPRGNYKKILDRPAALRSPYPPPLSTPMIPLPEPPPGPIEIVDSKFGDVAASEGALRLQIDEKGVRITLCLWSSSKLLLPCFCEIKCEDEKLRQLINQLPLNGAGFFMGDEMLKHFGVRLTQYRNGSCTATLDAQVDLPCRQDSRCGLAEVWSFGDGSVKFLRRDPDATSEMISRAIELATDTRYRKDR